jgi:hypothetical protein
MARGYRSQHRVILAKANSQYRKLRINQKRHWPETLGQPHLFHPRSYERLGIWQLVGLDSHCLQTNRH